MGSKLLEFDSKIFDADLLPLLGWLLEGTPKYAFLVEDKGEIQGYCLGRPGEHFVHIEPVLANTIKVAKYLVSAALSNCIGRTVILDISHIALQWNAWLTSIGFVEQRPFFRMYRGSNNFPGMPKKQFAILGPEFG